MIYLEAIMVCGRHDIGPTGSTDWKDAELNPENQEQYNCVGAMLCFQCIRRLDPLQVFLNLYYFYICLSVLKMYWVVLTVDYRNSICRNRVCLNSVCLPIFGMPTIGGMPNTGVNRNIGLQAHGLCQVSTC